MKGKHFLPETRAVKFLLETEFDDKVFDKIPVYGRKAFEFKSFGDRKQMEICMKMLFTADQP